MVFSRMRSTLAFLVCFMFAGYSIADDGVPLSDVVSTLLVGGGVLSKLMWAVCIVVGVALIAAAFTQFQIHRRNPKLVPLATPILYLILGILAIAVPFIGQVKGFMSPGVQGVKGSPAPPPTTKQNYNPNDIDAPIN